MASEEKTKQEKQGNPAPEGKKEVAKKTDEKGVPLENRVKEYERKYQKAVEQNDQLSQKIAEIEAKMDSGDSQKEIKEDIFADLDEYDRKLAGKVMGVVEQRMKRHQEQLKQELSPLKERSLVQSRETNLDELERKDSKGIVSKYRNEIEEELDKYPPATWENKETVEIAKARVIDRHLDEIVGRREEKKEAPTETQHGGGSEEGATGNEAEARKMATKYNCDIKQAQKILEKKRKALKARR